MKPVQVMSVPRWNWIMVSILTLSACKSAHSPVSSDIKSSAAGMGDAAPLPAEDVSSARLIASKSLRPFSETGDIDAQAPLGHVHLNLNDLASRPNAQLLALLKQWDGGINFAVTSAGKVIGVFALDKQPDESIVVNSFGDDFKNIFGRRATDLKTSGLQDNAYFHMVVAPLNRDFLCRVDRAGSIQVTPLQNGLVSPGTWINTDVLFDTLRPLAQKMMKMSGGN